MDLHFYILWILLLMFINCKTNTIDCPSTNSCASQTLNCTGNEPCTINCLETKSCKYKTLNCTANKHDFSNHINLAVKCDDFDSQDDDEYFTSGYEMGMVN
eukprot:100798_1